MFETMSSWFAKYSDLVAHNPILAALMLPVIPTLAYACREIPKMVYRKLNYHLTTSMEMNNAGWSGNEDQYNAFMTWFMQTRWAKWSRNIYVGGRWSGDGRTIVIGPGKGNHFFFWKGRLFWFNKGDLPSSGSDKQKEEITLHTLGRSHQPILELIDAFKYVEKVDKVGVYAYTKDGWTRVTSIVKRPLATVCVPREVKAEIQKRFDKFIEDPDWFRSKGLPYKMTFLLKGLPGTGKTTLVKSLASHYNRSIMVLDLNEHSNASLAAALASIPNNSILLVEDIDASTHVVASRKRSSLLPPTVTEEDKAKLSSAKSSEVEPLAGTASIEAVAPAVPQDDVVTTDRYTGFLTLSGILNAFDGVIPMDNVIVFWTTNHPEVLDPALLRKGRVDYPVEIGYMGNAEVRDYIAVMFPDYEIPDGIVFPYIPGCDIEALFKDNCNNPDDFVAAIATYKQHTPLRAVS